MLPVHDDAAHRVPWLAALVEHHLETERRWHIERRAVTVLGKAPLAGCDERAGEKFPFGIVLAEVRGHWCGSARFRHKRHHGVGVLAGDVDATIVPQLHVEGVHHCRNLLGLREHLLEAEGVAVPVVERDVAILAPRVRDVEVVAHQCEAARDVQRMRGRRWIEEQRMHLARGAVVFEDADVVDAVPRFTAIADPPHGSVLPNTIAASSEPARDNVLHFSQQASGAENYVPRNSTGHPGIISRLGLLRVFVTTVSGDWSQQTPGGVAAYAKTMITTAAAARPKCRLIAEDSNDFQAW